jgi:hypothetical protein
VHAKVRAHNQYGYGSTSPVNAAGVTIQTIPGQVQGLMAGSTTSTQQVELVWTAMLSESQTGGAPILSYNLQWDGGLGLGVYEDLVGYGSDFTATGYTITSGIAAGVDYKFQVRAMNMWGWGAFSEVLTATPYAAPGQMVPVVATIEPKAGAVVLTWRVPSDNSSPITQYKIEILDHDGAAWHTLSGCDGSSAAVMTARKCTIPMSQFTLVPLSLQRGDLIQARASALNAKGWGTASVPNTAGANVRTAPTRMNAPVRDPASSESQIIVTWAALTAVVDTGGSPIISHGLEWSADGAGTWVALTGQTVRTLTTTFTVSTGLTTGHAYLFRVRAENAYGWGPYSTVTTVYAAGVPGQPYQPATAVVGTDVRVTWGPPGSEQAPISAYKVLIRRADGQFVAELTSCDGSTQAVLGALACNVPLSILRAAPFSLAFGALVQVRV